jgi:hypothetical protein
MMHRIPRDGLALLLGAVVALCGPGTAVQAEIIQAGLDFLETDASGNTYENLADLGLLCPPCTIGSDTTIVLRGIPLVQSPHCPEAGLGNVDTIVRRITDTSDLGIGDSDTIDIEIVELHLQSIEPFEVHCGANTYYWMLDVALIPGTQPIGTMTITKTHDNGGVFDSDLPVIPYLIFTRVDDCPPTVVCEGPGPEINFNATGAPWVHQPPYDILHVPGCTTNFVAGVDGSGGRSMNVGFDEMALLRAHGLLPPLPPMLIQNSWQKAIHFTFTMTNPGGKTTYPTINRLRMLHPRWISVPPGLPDSSVYFKSNSICNLDTLCTTEPTSWCKVNWDSTDALYQDEAWWFFQPVPVDSMAPEMDVVFSIPDSCYTKPGGESWYEVDVEAWSDCAVVDTLTFRFHCDTTSTKPGTGVPEAGPRVRHSFLEQNFPNPFRPVTTIRYTLDRDAEVSLKIYDVRGAVVRVLHRGRQEEGAHSFQWDGRSEDGRRVATGVYFYQLQVGDRREAKKMIRLE